MAHALGTSTDSIKRLLRELAEAGWLVRTEGRGRGNRAQIVFLWGNNVVPMVRSDSSGAPSNDLRNDPKRAATQADKRGADAPFYSREPAAQKGADMGGKGGTGALSYNKADLKSKKEESARKQTPVSQRTSGRPDYTAYDRATAPETWSGVLFTIKRGGNAEAAWNDWLTCHGFPTLAEIGPGSGADGWAVPCTLPPRPDGDRFEVSRAEKWARIFSRKAKGVANV